jgi:alpha-beta hydrolase superfamily lysophospholipase
VATLPNPLGRVPDERHPEVLLGLWAHKLGEHVTLARIHGALHDVTLSRLEVRERAFAEITRWLEAYVER